MRIIICGGRDFANEHVIDQFLNALPPEAVVVHGDAHGADLIAARLWAARGGVCEAHPADWSKGKRAGPLRNQEMIDAGVDLVAAFHGGRGTADMVKRADAAGVTVLEIQT